MERGKDKAPCPPQGNGALLVFCAAPSCLTPPGSQSGLRISKRYTSQVQKLWRHHKRTCRGGQDKEEDRTQESGVRSDKAGMMEEWKDGKREDRTQKPGVRRQDLPASGWDKSGKA
jgi:hypothetical protein